MTGELIVVFTILLAMVGMVAMAILFSKQKVKKDIAENESGIIEKQRDIIRPDTNADASERLRKLRGK